MFHEDSFETSSFEVGSWLFGLLELVTGAVDTAQIFIRSAIDSETVRYVTSSMVALSTAIASVVAYRAEGYRVVRKASRKAHSDTAEKQKPEGGRIKKEVVAVFADKELVSVQKEASERVTLETKDSSVAAKERGIAVTRKQRRDALNNH